MSEALKSVREKLESLKVEQAALAAAKLRAYEALVVDVTEGQSRDAAAMLAVIEDAGKTYQQFETDVNDLENVNRWKATAATKGAHEAELAAHAEVEKEYMERRKRESVFTGQQYGELVLQRF